MTNHLKRWSVWTVLGGVLAALVFAAPYAAAQESTLTTVQKRGKLLVGVTYDSPPTGYLDAQGSLLGYTPDLARYIAKRLGVEVEFVQITAATRVDTPGSVVFSRLQTLMYLDRGPNANRAIREIRLP